MASKKPRLKKSYNLYYKGKPLKSQYKETVKLIAESKNIKVNTDKRLYDYYNKNKELFEKRFASGEESIPQGTNSIIKDFKEAKKSGKQFYIETEGVKKKVTFNQIVYELIATENYINELLDTTGFMQMYHISYDGDITLKIPERIEEPEFLEGDTGEQIEYLVDEFNIVVYPMKQGDEEKELHYKKSLKKRLKDAKERLPKRKKQSAKKKKIIPKRKERK